MAAAAACALATKTQSIGAGVFNPYGRHPTLIAMEIGALDELSGGRVRLGIGSGLGHAVERMGFSTKRSLTTLREAIAIVRALLRGEEVNFCRHRVQRAAGQARLSRTRRHSDLHGGARAECGEGLRRDRRRPDRVEHVRGGLCRQGGGEPA